MKKISIVTIFMLILSVSFIYSGEKQELWLKAISEKNVKVRFQFLKEFSEKFGKDKRYFKNLNINLTKTAFFLKDFDKTIQYGEKVITVNELEDNYKIEMYIYLANSYYVTKIDLDKAYQYAGLVIDLAKNIKKGFGENSNLKKQINANYLAPALSIQSIVLGSKGKDDPETLKNALSKALEVLEFDTSKRTKNRIFLFAIALYKKDPTMVNESLGAVKKILNASEETNPRYASLIGQWYLKNKDRENAVKFISLAYSVDKKAKFAMRLGQLLHKSSPKRAIDYFAEAYLLDNSEKESNAYKYLRQLWYNNLAKGKPLSEQDKGFDEILTLAKSRLNPNSDSVTEDSDIVEDPKIDNNETDQT